MATAVNGETALGVLAEEELDLVLLDLGLPGMDGGEVLRRLRARSDVPVIVISVREARDDKVAALDAGADDYVTKPFGMKQLLARMRAASRRAAVDRHEPPVLRIDGLEVDLVRRLLRLDGASVHLTPTEYRLMRRWRRTPAGC